MSRSTPRRRPAARRHPATVTDRALRAHLAAATLPACALGAALPGLADSLRHCHPATGVTPPMLMLLVAMFVGGYEVRAVELGRALLRPGLLLSGLAVALLLRMVVLLGAERAVGCWPDHREALWLVVGLSLTATMPVAGAAQTWGAKAQADAPLGVGLVLATTLASPLTVPLGLALAEEPEGSGPRAVLDALAQADSTCAFMALWVAAPCLAGMAARRLTRGRARETALPWLRLLGLANALGLTFLNAAGVAGAIGHRPDPRLVGPALLAGAAVCALPFLAGWLTARRARARRDAAATLTLASGLNNTSAAAALAGCQFTGHPAVLLPIFFYGATQQLLAACLPRLLRPRPGPDAFGAVPTLRPGPAATTAATCGDVPTLSPRPDFTHA
ncbi:hypothetical protein CFP65_6399 [Kitasatospora sp. MMS16-BH015]|uniref:hypothetical protein n=1 Tax=Kitasatospora sp. MMS16-BH015 TaxID=2018025 RepID=UPI000CA10DF0|nr:hypothetical protein [Kitasatospora sp. MMS16-BH015]AUG81055.1 hypothetical protein CFP65_6399 [Kitasatospora sp. MMS16-BH015]